MRYTVVWLPYAASVLANLANIADEQSIADASNRIVRSLADDPELKGQTYGKFWSRTEPPLEVLYDIVPEDRLVRIITVRQT